MGELAARFTEDGKLGTNRSLIDLGYDLRCILDHVLDVHWNRFARARYANIFAEIRPLLQLPGCRRDLRGATVVELGCGSWNPFGLCFLFLLLGAARTYAIDLDPPCNRAKAARALAELAAMLLLDAGSVVGAYPITRAELLRHADGFDLARLAQGDEAGVDGARLRHAITAADQTPLADGEADLVYSTSFLEHVLDPDAVLAELRRITRAGGVAYHGLDATDHRRYRLPGHGPLDYLTEAGQGDVVMYSKSYGINRLRPHEFVARFQRHGFEILRTQVVERLDPTKIDRTRFVEPYRSMSVEDLAVLRTKILVRKR